MLAFCQQPPVFLWHTIIRSFSCFWLKNKVLRHVSPRALALSEVKMLLHSCMANFVIFVKPIIKPIFRRRIFQNAVLRNRILNIVSVWARSLPSSLNSQKIRFISEAEWNFVDFIIGPWVLFLLLNGDLFFKFWNTARHLKPAIFTLAVFLVAKALIIGLWAIAGDRGRRPALKINMALREPGKFSPTLKTPIWVCHFSRDVNFVTD